MIQLNVWNLIETTAAALIIIPGLFLNQQLELDYSEIYKYRYLGLPFPFTMGRNVQMYILRVSFCKNFNCKGYAKKLMSWICLNFFQVKLQLFIRFLGQVSLSYLTWFRRDMVVNMGYSQKIGDFDVFILITHSVMNVC